MNCNDVQNRLSEYLEKALDAETLKTVDEHLASCPRCRAEVDSLARTVKIVAALPEVEPPVGFTTRVLAQVREIEGEPSFWQRLYLPFRTKIPLQTTAVVLIGILAVYLFQKEQAEKSELLPYQKDSSPQQAERAVEPAPPLAASPDKKGRVGSETPVHDTKPQTERQQQKPSQMPRDSGEQARPAPKESGSAEQAARLEEKKESAAASPPAAPLMEEKPKAPDQLRPGMGRLQSTEIAKEGAGSSAPAAARSQLAALNYDLVLRLREPPREKQALSGQLDSLRTQGEPDRSPAAQEARGVIARYLPSIPRSNRAETFWLSIPQADYDQFKKELATLGIIEAERQIVRRDKETFSKPHEPLLIRLTILPARNAGQDAPAAQPSPSR